MGWGHRDAKSRIMNIITKYAGNKYPVLFSIIWPSVFCKITFYINVPHPLHVYLHFQSEHDVMRWFGARHWQAYTMAEEQGWHREREIAILFTEAVCFYLLNNGIHASQSSVTPSHDVITKTAARGPFWSHSS